MESSLATLVQFHQDSGMHLIGSHRPLYVHIPQRLSNLIFADSGKHFASLLCALSFIHSRGGVKGRLPVKTGKELSSSSAFSLSAITILPVMFREGCTFLDLPFLAHMPSEAFLLLFASLDKFISSCTLASLTPS